MAEKKADRAARAVKKLDFVSRLQDHLDIKGYDNASGSEPKNIIRRAILIRSKLEERVKGRKEGKAKQRKENPVFELDPSVLDDLLVAEIYKHGARLVDNIFKGCTIREGKVDITAIPSEEVGPMKRRSSSGGGSSLDET